MVKHNQWTHFCYRYLKTEHKPQIHKLRIYTCPTSFALKCQNGASSGGNADCKSSNWHYTHSSSAFFKRFNFHACSKNICWRGRKTFQQAKLWASKLFMKTWLGYYTSASKMFVAKWFKQSIKIKFSKPGNCASILVIFFDTQKITRSYCNITNHVLLVHPACYWETEDSYEQGVAMRYCWLVSFLVSINIT